MKILFVLSAILFGAVSPAVVPSAYGTERVLAMNAEEYMIVAMLPIDEVSHEERVRVLHAAAEDIAARTGKEVILTDDLLAYLSLKRMSARGVSDYERRVLASRLSHGEGRLYHASTPTESSGHSENAAKRSFFMPLLA